MMRWRLAPGNPMTRVAALTLVFQALTEALAIAAVVLAAHVPLLPATLLGGVAILLGLAAAVTLRRAVGWPLAWAAQVAGIALGVLNGWALVAFGLFTLLLVVVVVLGGRLPDAGPAR